MKYYPLKLYSVLTVKEDEVAIINNFFNTTKVRNKTYDVIVWVEGEEKNQVGIIPIGSPAELSLQVGNHTIGSRNIRDIFSFEINAYGLYHKCTTISEWLNDNKAS